MGKQEFAFTHKANYANGLIDERVWLVGAIKP
jgi:hypothetical protein